METPMVSVIMPVYNQAQFLCRAVRALQNQVFTHWELIIINDGSPDETHDTVYSLLRDERITYHRNMVNTGLGAALNIGLDHARGDLITYLPADDLIHRGHLASLTAVLLLHPTATLAYTGTVFRYNKVCDGVPAGEWLQLVQVMHRKTTDRWTDRYELESDNLNTLFWNKLDGERVSTGAVTCEWVDHPAQRHKIMREPIGGINPFKQYYQIQQPLRYHTSTGNFIDEAELYLPFREKQPTDHSTGLTILLVGELAYNAERILALEEAGHTLYGLWMKEPYWYNTIGPLPFGHVEDIPYENWQQRVAEIQPDVIYALLNWQAVPFACEILRGNPGIPFVWHFKEGPFICLEKGT